MDMECEILLYMQAAVLSVRNVQTIAICYTKNIITPFHYSRTGHGLYSW